MGKNTELKTSQCKMIAFVLHLPCPRASLPGHMPEHLFAGIKTPAKTKKTVIILSFNINYNSISHDELMLHYVAFKCIPKGL